LLLEPYFQQRELRNSVPHCWRSLIYSTLTINYMLAYIDVIMLKMEQFMSGIFTVNCQDTSWNLYSTANILSLYGYSVNPNSDLFWLLVTMQSGTRYKAWLGYETMQFPFDLKTFSLHDWLQRIGAKLCSSSVMAVLHVSISERLLQPILSFK